MKEWSWWKILLIVIGSVVGLVVLVVFVRRSCSGGRSRQNNNPLRNYPVRQQPRSDENNISTTNQPAVIHNIHSSEGHLVGLLDARRYHPVINNSDLSGVSDDQANHPAVINSIHASEVKDDRANYPAVIHNSDLSGVSDGPPSYRAVFPQGCPSDPYASASSPPSYPGS